MVKMHADQVKSPAPRPEPGSMNDSNRKEANTFLNDISSILFLLKLTGLLPIYQTISIYQLGPPTGIGRVYTISVHALVHAMTVYNLYNLFSAGYTQLCYSYRETDNVNYWIEILLSMITYTTTVVLCFIHSKNFLQILNDLLKVDNEIYKRFSANFVNDCGFAAKYIILIALVQFYITILKIWCIDEPLAVPSYILIGSFSVQCALSSIFIVFVSILLRILTVRFAYLNSIVNGYTYREQQCRLRQRTYRLNDIRSRGNVMLQPPSMESFPDTSLFVFHMHNKLLRLYKAINESCSLILVVYMGYAFYSITTTTYNLFVQITTQRDISSVVLQICALVLFLHTAMLVLLSRCCGQTTHQVDKFLTKSIKQEIQFTAYGYFVIDDSSLFKIFSAVTTYLVILIQFKQLEESKMNESEASIRSPK